MHDDVTPADDRATREARTKLHALVDALPASPELLEAWAVLMRAVMVGAVPTSSSPPMRQSPPSRTR